MRSRSLLCTRAYAPVFVQRRILIFAPHRKHARDNDNKGATLFPSAFPRRTYVSLSTRCHDGRGGAQTGIGLTSDRQAFANQGDGFYDASKWNPFTRNTLSFHRSNCLQ
jgi:hypothetical protein